MYSFSCIILLFLSLSTKLLAFHGQKTDGRHRYSKGDSHSTYKGLPPARKDNTEPDFTKCKSKSGLCNSLQQLNSINSFLVATSRKHPETTKLNVIGRSYNGAPIYSLEIFQEVDSAEFITVVVEFGMHGREWASSTSGMYMISKLLDHEENCTKSVRWFILPLLNPDGYQYSLTEDNMWKKNRIPLNTSETCFGVDLDRNFDVGWDLNSGVDPCKEDYAGSRPFSELESKALRRFIERLGPFAVDVYVSVHSCGQAILYPYGYSTKELSGWRRGQLLEAGAVMVKEMKKLRNRNYDLDVAYKVGGLRGRTADYMFERFRIPFVYTLELGDRMYFDEYDFHHCYHPPSAQLMEFLNEECHVGLTALASHVAALRESAKGRYYEPRSFNSSPTYGYVNLIALIALLL